MKIIKCVLMLLVCCALLFSAMPITGVATTQDDFEISCDSASVYAGSDVSLDIVLNNNPGFSALNIALVYDTPYIEQKSITNSASSLYMTAGSTIVWDGAENYTEDGTLATVSFSIADNTPVGDYKVKIIFMGASNDAFEEVQAVVNAGTITVKCCHTNTTVIPESPADCNNSGYTEGEWCSDCETYISGHQTIPATGHTVVKDDAVASTCTETGLTEGSHCSVCNVVIKTQEIVSAKGHIEGDWEITQEATVYSAGKKIKKCTVCGTTVKNGEIPQLKCAKPVLKRVYNANSYVKVTWGTVKGADKYRVYRKTGTGEYEYIGSTAHTYFNDKEAGAGKTCRYRIKAKNEAGYSSYSTSIAIKHIDEPILKSIANSTYGVLIKWDKITGAEKYNVYRKVSGGTYKYIGATTNTYYTDKTAQSGTKYYYAIRSKRDISVSSQSASLSKYYLADPTLKTITNTEYGVKITWGKVTGAEKYNVYRKVSGGAYKYIGATSNAYYTDKTAESGTKYYYEVRAKKGETVSALSSAKSIYHLADTTLNTPSSTASGIKLSWSKVTGAEGYMVYRKTGSGSYSKIATLKGSTKVIYTDSSAKKGKKYTYKIKAYKSKTYSAYSNTKTITDKY